MILAFPPRFNRTRVETVSGLAASVSLLFPRKREGVLTRALAIARSWIPAFPLRCFAASARQVAWMMVIFIIGIASPAAA
ncbi:MAG: hypothetical protein AB7S81_09105, partial [Bdellovibrionales bacterium]